MAVGTAAGGGVAVVMQMFRLGELTVLAAIAFKQTPHSGTGERIGPQ